MLSFVDAHPLRSVLGAASLHGRATPKEARVRLGPRTVKHDEPGPGVQDPHNGARVGSQRPEGEGRVEGRCCQWAELKGGAANGAVGKIVSYILGSGWVLAIGSEGSTREWTTMGRGV